MIVGAVDHISFSVSDLERSRRFYEGVLGLGTIPRPDFGGLPGVWYGAGNCQVHLIQRPPDADLGTPPPALSPLANHQAFAIDDYEKTLAHLRQHGVEVLETTPENGQMWVRDPDGHVIELIDPGARS